MTQSPFEIPQQMRELAEKNIEQARAAYDQFMGAMNQAMGMWAQSIPGDGLTSGFKAVQDRATTFAKQNAEAGFALASDLAKAKDVPCRASSRNHKCRPTQCKPKNLGG